MVIEVVNKYKIDSKSAKHPMLCLFFRLKSILLCEIYLTCPPTQLLFARHGKYFDPSIKHIPMNPRQQYVFIPYKLGDFCCIIRDKVWVCVCYIMCF